MIYVCMPYAEEIKGRTTADLVQLFRYELRDVVDFIPCEGSQIPNQRILLVKEARKRGGSHVLFLDSDMRFPANILGRMLRHGLPIVAANCIDKRTGNQTWHTTADGYSYVGCAVMLIELRVFDKLSEPWFAQPWDGTKLVGEDMYFCRKVQDAGFQILVDEGLSEEIRHIGQQEYGVK